MRKKVIDVFPPQNSQRITIDKKPEKAKNNGAYSVKQTDSGKRERKRKREGSVFSGILTLNLGFKKKSLVKFSLALAALVIVSFVLIASLAFAKAKIEIWPEQKVLQTSAIVSIDKSKSQLDVKAGIIPGEILEKEKQASQTFQASGKSEKEQKAEGMIKIFNEFSTSPQVLLASTRFVSAEGKLFRVPGRVTVPGGKMQKGKLVAGEIEIKVVADQPGPEYNIDKSTFSLPGFAGTDKYTKIYAKSFKSMAGGYSGESPQVTADDLRKAEDFLSKQAIEGAIKDLEDSLKAEDKALTTGYIKEIIKTDIVEKTSSVAVGQEVKEFTVSVKASAKTLTFKKKDFDDFVKSYVASKSPESMIVYGPSLSIKNSPININLDSGKSTVSLDITAKIYSEMKEEILKGAIQGKSLSETKLFIGSQPGVQKVDVKFTPFWMRSAPMDIDRIKLNMNID